MSYMFNKFTYTKTGNQISDNAHKKIQVLKNKIQERETRIMEVRKQHNITDKDLVQLLREVLRSSNQMTLTIPSFESDFSCGREVTKVVQKEIPTSIVQVINSEQNSMENEKSEIHRLELVSRNISLEKSYELSYDELDYLKF